MKELSAVANWMKNRPSSGAVLAMVAGSFLALRISIIPHPPFSGSLALSIATILSIFALVKKDRSHLHFWTYLIFFISGFGLASSNLWVGQTFESPKKLVVHATVKRLLSSGDNFRVFLLENGITYPAGDILPGYGRLMLRNNPISLSSGDRMSFKSSIRKPSNRGNPGEYNWEVDCLNEGIVWLASTRESGSVVILKRGHRLDPARIAYDIRQSMIDFIDSNSGKYFKSETPGDVKAILKGIVLGDRGEISSEVNRSFSDSGLVHTFSASGVHVTIVGLMAFFLVKSIFCLRPKWLLSAPLPVAGSIAAIPAILIYCVLVGFKPPSMRATMMGIILGVSVLGQKRWDSLNTVTVASLIIIMIYPLSFMTPSFQLSFAAVIGIIMMMESDVSSWLRKTRPQSDKHKSGSNLFSLTLNVSINFVKRPLVSVLLVTIAATIATGPIVAQLFHRIPIYSVFANLLAEFPVSFGLTFGLTASVVSIFSADLGSLILSVADLSIWMVIKFANFFASLPCAVIHVPEMGDVGLLFSILSTILFFMILRAPSRKTLLSFCATTAGFFVVLAISHIQTNLANSLTATFLNVGNGDSAFVRPPQTNGFLIDGGPITEFFDAGQSIIVPFLLSKSVKGLNAVILSHPQADHYGGLFAAVKHAPTEKVHLNQINNYSEKIFKKRIREIQNNVTFNQADRNSPDIWIGDCRISFINQPISKKIHEKVSNAEVNDTSCVLRIDYSDFSILFLGDLEKSAENYLLTSGEDLRATVLKVAHHAGKTSATSESLLAAVMPKIAIISADYPARGGIPNPDVVDRLEKICPHVYWTGRDGAITVTTSGSGPTKVLLGKTGSTHKIE